MTQDARDNAAGNDGGKTLFADGLLRPEPKPENGVQTYDSFAFFGLAFAALALVAIYVGSPVDLPEFPDCPIQAIGSCGQN